MRGDPRPWLLECEEPAALYIALTGLLDVPEDSPEAEAAHRAVIADPGTRALVEGLQEWDSPKGFPGHDSPRFVVNGLQLLADMGLRAGDSPIVERLLDQILEHQDHQGRFTSFGTLRSRSEPLWGALLCDTHAAADVLLRYGRGGDPRIGTAVTSVAADMQTTAQGPGWPCRPEAQTGFRGPGRKGDLCPQATLEALRVASQLPADRRPAGTLPAARTVLGVWRQRADAQPYMFGHGVRFKRVKWPNLWYDSLWVLETLGRFPELWRTSGPAESETCAAAQDRAALAELAACLVAYNVDANGRVIPQRTYRGFETFSFGQKKKPSPFATVRVAVALRRLGDLADDVRSVDIARLGSSKGGSGTPVPPRL
jgi:hypothetical protein